MALYYREKSNDNSELAIWELTESEPEAARLAAALQAMPETIKSEKRRKEYAAVRALLHEIFGTGHSLEHYPNGRPYLSSGAAQISIAHTRRFVVVLTHPDKRVGVDIECLERDFSAVERRALSGREISFLSKEFRSLHLAIMWSAKEALYKCMSQEDIDFALQMRIEPFAPEESGTLCARFLHKDQSSTTHFLKYKTVDNHILVYMFA